MGATQVQTLLCVWCNNRTPNDAYNTEQLFTTTKTTTESTVNSVSENVGLNETKPSRKSKNAIHLNQTD